jgi:predicted metal-binding protein
LGRERDRVKGLETYCEKALEMEIDGAKVIDPHSVVTAEWVRLKCQFGCSHFGMNLCCPPHTPTPEVTQKVINSYGKALLLYRRLKNGEMTKGFNEIIVRLEIKIFLDGYYKVFSMGSGRCRLCKECGPNGFCRQGRVARPSMEACGIDVFKTARDNGFPIEVVKTREEERNIFGLILVE